MTDARQTQMRPRSPVDELDAARRIQDSAQRTLSILDRTTVRLIGIRPAQAVCPAITHRRYLHAGPPLDIEELPGPTQGALVGALIFEGQARDTEEAAAIIARGDLELQSGPEVGAVGAIAGIVSPTMPVVVVESSAGNLAFSPLNEGMGTALRFGANGQETLYRLTWLRDVFAKVLDKAIQRVEIELTSLQVEGLRRGDECHNRTIATGSALLLALCPAIYRAAASTSEADRVVTDAKSNPHFFVPFSMASAKAIADAAHGIPGSPIATSLAANGVRVGIRVSGLSDSWFTAPASAGDAVLFADYRPQDVQPTLGDSLIIETVGLGAFALSAAPAICSYIGGRPSESSELVEEMRMITGAESTRFLIPQDNFRGSPLGIDTRKVACTGIRPLTNTGLAHRAAGIGQVGAGLTRLPIGPFEQASQSLGSAWKVCDGILS